MPEGSECQVVESTSPRIVFTSANIVFIFDRCNNSALLSKHFFSMAVTIVAAALYVRRVGMFVFDTPKKALFGINSLYINGLLFSELMKKS